jgi:hypothetical protein
MAKALKIWNGRGYCCHKRDDPRWNGIAISKSIPAYVAAYSRADARKVIAEYCGHEPADSELRDYWAAGCWGSSMDGVVPERGLWLQFDSKQSPVRVI